MAKAKPKKRKYDYFASLAESNALRRYEASLEPFLLEQEQQMKKNRAALSIEEYMQFKYGWYSGFIAALRAVRDELQPKGRKAK